MKLEFQKSKTAVFFHFSMQYSFQLADTVGAKKNCRLIGDVRLLESFQYQS